MAVHQQDELQILSFFTSMQDQGGIVTTDVPRLDIESYISNYKGRTRFDRLLLIGQSSVPLCIDALKAAIAEAKAGKDVQRYREAWECIRHAAPSEAESQLDESWLNATTISNQNVTRQLEAELKEYKNNLIKESIRIGQRDLGKHLESIGNLSGAADAYAKMRPDSSTASHIVDVGKHIINVLLQKRDWTNILAHANKIMTHNLTPDEINAEQPYQRMVAGLAYLGSEKYAEAAKCFLDTGDATACQRYSDVASPNDVATYGGLLALASMDRDELQQKVLDNSSFRNYLELEPQIRKAISMFVNCRFSACLEILELCRTDCLLDLYLQKHVSKIFSLIRQKCIVQYLSAFSTVTLNSMTAMFGKLGEDIQLELIAMIKGGGLKARINTMDKLLVMRSEDPRLAMQKKALDSINSFVDKTTEQIRRMNLVAADLEVKGPHRKGGGGGLPGFSEIFPDDIAAESNVGIEGIN